MKVFTTDQHGFYYHIMHLDEGEVIPTHEHTSYRHRMKCVAGEAEIWSGDGGSVLMTPGRIKTIPAGVAHDIVARKNGTVIGCVHRLFDKNGRYYPFEYQLTPREVYEATARL